MDLENYVNANKDNIFAGWHSNTDDIFAIMNFKANAGAPMSGLIVSVISTNVLCVGSLSPIL